MRHIDMYFAVFPKDRTWWKILVVGIVLLEIVETLSSARDMFHVFGNGWGDMGALDAVGWAWLSVPVVGSISELFVDFWRDAAQASLPSSRMCMSNILRLADIPYWAKPLRLCRRYHGESLCSLSEIPNANRIQISVVQLGAGIWTGVNICITGRFSLFQSYNLVPTAVRTCTNSMIRY